LWYQDLQKKASSPVAKLLAASVANMMEVVIVSGKTMAVKTEGIVTMETKGGKGL
jgi:hypothetical protein